jgi:hypothetical protein
MQRCPVAQGAPLFPHEQTPLRHLSVVTDVQPMHVEPPIPQADVVVGVVQVAPLQQPLPHEAASQIQTALEHRCPAPQLGPDPHLQDPFTSHESALRGSQAVQADPLFPQVAVLLPLQVAPSQQPSAQFSELHSPVQKPPSQL